MLSKFDRAYECETDRQNCCSMYWTCMQLSCIVKKYLTLVSLWNWCGLWSNSSTVISHYFVSLSWKVFDTLHICFQCFVTYLFVVCCLCRDKTNVVSRTEKCTERFSNNSKPQTKAINKGRNSASSTKQSMFGTNDMAEHQISGLGNASTVSTTA